MDVLVIPLPPGDQLRQGNDEASKQIPTHRRLPRQQLPTILQCAERHEGKLKGFIRDMHSVKVGIL